MYFSLKSKSDSELYILKNMYIAYNNGQSILRLDNYQIQCSECFWLSECFLFCPIATKSYLKNVVELNARH